MQTIADHVIDALGGTTAVSRLTAAPLSTVHSWRKIGIPPSRLAHLRLAAKTAPEPVDIDAVVERARASGAPDKAQEAPAEAA